MRRFTLCTADGRTVSTRCARAESPLRRMRGLLGRRSLEPDEGLLLRPAGSVHTAFMRFPIDVVFLAGDGAVLRVVSALGPWRAAGCRGAHAVVELPAGKADDVGLLCGDRLELPARVAETPNRSPALGGP